MTNLFTKWNCRLLLLLLFSSPACAQINITGKVVDEKDNAPLPGASVYFNNTTIGTYTDAQGFFNFENTRLLNTELVISCPGYDLLLYKPVAEKIEKKRIVFKLHAATDLQKNRMVLTEETRKRYLDIFYRSILGTSKEALKCTVANQQDIYFLEINSNTGFVAYADTPIVFINNLLGYKISYNLEEFLYDEGTGQNSLSGYTRYQDLGKEKKWLKNRQDCYYGSSLHFYRSVVANQLYEQGFSTFLIEPETDTSMTGTHKDRVVLPDYGIMKASPVTAHQILSIDSSNNLSIKNNGRLLVQYYKDPPSKSFLNQNGLFSGSLAKGIQCYIILKMEAIGINYAGVLSNPEGVQYSGFWVYEKAANSLPYDYQPE